MKFKEILIIIVLVILTFAHAWITKPIQNRYEVVSLNESNYVVIDHKEGKIYQKYVEPNAGPSDFSEIILPE